MRSSRKHTAPALFALLIGSGVLAAMGLRAMGDDGDEPKENPEEETGRQPQAEPEGHGASSTLAPESPDDIQVPPPPFSEGVFPCSECHAYMDANTTRRQLTEEHTNIVLKHDEEHRWCLDCHDAENRDKLKLANGTLVDFAQSYVLCGQCHGPKLRDWKAGVHGKRTGDWNGKKKYLLCAHCHDPHAPKFKPLKPEPPPVRPEDLP